MHWCRKALLRCQLWVVCRSTPPRLKDELWWGLPVLAQIVGAIGCPTTSDTNKCLLQQLRDVITMSRGDAVVVVC